MVLVERQGLPLGICLAPATPAETSLVDQTLAARLTPHRRQPRRLVGDKGYDSDPLRAKLLTRGIRLICPYRAGRVNRPFEDRRRLRVYGERWTVERTIAWFGAFRRLLIRHDRSTRMFLAFFQFAAALIVLRRL
jgi:transposase